LEVKILDKTGQQLTVEQVEQLNIWNATMAHICASVLERLQQANISASMLVAEA